MEGIQLEVVEKLEKEWGFEIDLIGSQSVHMSKKKNWGGVLVSVNEYGDCNGMTYDEYVEDQLK